MATTARLWINSKPSNHKMDVTFSVKLPFMDISQHFGLMKSELGVSLFLRTPRGYRRLNEAPFKSVDEAKVWVQNRHLCYGAIEH